MEVLKHPLVTKAAAFAAVAHAGVTRKWSGEPYIEHPTRVATRLAELAFAPEVIAAAFLHDVVEDTDVTVTELAAKFGPVVAALVAEVTKPKIPKETSTRATRKAAFRAHLAKSSYEGASIKLSDGLDNSSNVVVVNPRFAATYLPEIGEDLKVLGHGHPALVAELAAHLAGMLP
jgi:(p)ppGpp synthase/HD superfamily hydrolase